MNKNIISIAIVAFFWGAATVMVFSVLPMFLVDVLHASNRDIGRIESVAMFLAFIAKILSGVASDYFKARKPLIVFGAIGTVIVKLMFAFANSTYLVFVAKSSDRFAKGIRSAPTDALIGDISNDSNRGKFYGLRQSMDVFGTLVGGFIASQILKHSFCNYKLVFYLSTIPAIFALFIVMFYVKQPTELKESKIKWTLKGATKLPKTFWIILIVTFFLMLARFSETFLNLRGRECGFKPDELPLYMTIYGVAYSCVSFYIGQIADHVNKKKLLLKGILLLAFTDLIVVALHDFSFSIIIAMILAGVHLGMTQGLIATIISDSTINEFRGTAFSIYYLTISFAVLIANQVAGELSHFFNSTIAAFAGGLIFTSISAIILSKNLKSNLQDA